MEKVREFTWAARDLFLFFIKFESSSGTLFKVSSFLNLSSLMGSFQLLKLPNPTQPLVKPRWKNSPITAFTANSLYSEKIKQQRERERKQTVFQKNK